MSGVLWLRTRAAWRRRWPSLLAIALLIAISLSVTLTAVAGARRSHSAPARFLESDGSPDLTMSFDEPLSLRGVSKVAALPQVRDVSANAAMGAYPISKGGDFMPVIAPVDGTAGIRIFRGNLLSGRRPDPRASDEIMLSESHARILGVAVGDRVSLSAFGTNDAQRCLYADEPTPDCGTIFRTPRLSLRVVGITRTSGDVNSREGDIMLSILGGKFFDRYRDRIVWNGIVFVRLRPGVSPDAFIAAARDVLPDDLGVEFDLRNANATFDAVNVLTTGLWLFALVAGLAGAFVVGQAVARQVRTQDADRDLLASLGATRRTLLGDALGPIMLAAVAGIGAALVGAYLASTLMPIGFARRIEPHRGHDVDWMVFLAGSALVLVLVVVAAAGAVRSSRRKAASSRPSRPLPVALAGLSPAAAVGLRHASSPGQGRRAVPIRSAFIGVTAATAGIVGVLGFSAGLTNLIDTPVLYGWTFDVVDINPADTARVVADPGVGAAADVWSAVPLRVNGRPVLGLAVKPLVGEIGPAIVSGRAPLAADEIALGADTLRAAHVGIGDAVVVEGTRGRQTMRVVGQSVFPTQSDAYPLADGAAIAPAALRTFGVGDGYDTLAIRYRPGADRAATFARLDALDAKRDPGAEPPDLPAPPAEIEKVRQVESLPKVLAAFLALLGAVALAHALVVGVRRRARDYAVLRSLGFRRRQVRGAVAWEAGVIAFAGALLGIPLGVVIARLAWARTAHNIGVLAVHSVPWAVVFVIVPAAVILAIVIALIPARRAAKLHPAEILRSE